MRVIHILAGLAILWSSFAEAQVYAPGAGDSPEKSPDQFWEELTSEAFAGIELSETQQVQIEAILLEATEDRGRYNEIQSRLKLAREEGDFEFAMKLSEELKSARNSLRPNVRVGKMRDLLNEDQRPVFDRNIRVREDRRLAEGWARQKKRESEVKQAAQAPGIPNPTNSPTAPLTP